MRKILIVSCAAATVISFGSSAYLRATAPTQPKVFDESGRQLQVGDVVASLTPVSGGGCAGNSAIVGKGQEGDGGGFVEASLDPHCQVIVTKIERAVDRTSDKRVEPATAPTAGDGN